MKTLKSVDSKATVSFLWFLSLLLRKHCPQSKDEFLSVRGKLRFIPSNSKPEFQSLSHLFITLGNVVSLCLVDDNQKDI